jgi:hypothetical protein
MPQSCINLQDTFLSQFPSPFSAIIVDQSHSKAVAYPMCKNKRLDAAIVNVLLYKVTFIQCLFRFISKDRLGSTRIEKDRRLSTLVSPCPSGKPMLRGTKGAEDSDYISFGMD